MRKKIVAGNWKMNTSVTEGIELAKAIVGQIKTLDKSHQVIICPPFTHLSQVGSTLSGSSVKLGAQNCHTNESGAYTGEVSAEMLKSISVEYCLVGHSERRAYNAETSEELAAKLKVLLSKNITPILCCGEQLSDRKTESHFEVISEQLEILWKLDKTDFAKIIVAYEPVWAIGTGETATAEQAQEIHAFIRGLIEKYFSIEHAENTTILYGGSCKPTNAVELFSKPDVDGGLIGGAALKAEDFIGIIEAF